MRIRVFVEKLFGDSVTQDHMAQAYRRLSLLLLSLCSEGFVCVCEDCYLVTFSPRKTRKQTNPEIAFQSSAITVQQTALEAGDTKTNIAE